ncbi:unnamed protein product [Anisakis simplex]|uniref:Cytochrome P450 n=1 Tax=Anisakis simplex TaxID=6269 RepID=A0A0M3KC63_ANISI|nr:unnamed protein product [Anisakis simplex]
MRIIAEIGDARGGIQVALIREIQNMIDSIDAKLQRGETHLDIEQTVFYVVGNVLTSFLFGRTYPHGSLEFKYVSAFSWQLFDLLTAQIHHEIQAAEVHQMMRDELEQRLQSQGSIAYRSVKFHYKDESKSDLTSVLLRKLDEVRSDRSATVIEQRNFNEDRIAMLMTEMFFAAIQTECNTFGWAFLYFIEHPQVQQKCRQQILAKFGTESRVRWSDRVHLPYVEATVFEVQRCANIAPFSVFHRNYHATTLDGYYVPANSTILMNLYSTLMDPNCFRGELHFSLDFFHFFLKTFLSHHTKMLLR